MKRNETGMIDDGDSLDRMCYSLGGPTISESYIEIVASSVPQAGLRAE